MLRRPHLEIPHPRILQFRRPRAVILVYLFLYAKVFSKFAFGPPVEFVHLFFMRKCKFRNATCRNCNTRGHIARACRKNGVNAVCAEGELTEGPLFEEDELFMVYDANAISRAEISVPLKVQNNDCSMQLDTGCALSLAPMSFFKRVCPDIDMQPTKVVLSSYTGETVRPLGEAYAKVEYLGLQHSLPLLVVQEALFGRNWLMGINVDWKNLPGLNHIEAMLPSATASQGNATMDSVLQRYDELFQSELGCYTGEPVVLNDSKGAKFHKARVVPYALQSKVESTLLKMEKRWCDSTCYICC